ncbi:MAG: hypothetical protein ABI947_25270 [Chloroflexota bacterium]
MTELMLVGLVVAVILAVVLSHRRQITWSGNLRRLHAGVSHRAEWMAPDEIVRGVELDYLAAQRWHAEALLEGYLRLLGEAPRYLTGSYLKRQQKIIGMQQHSVKCGVHFVGVLHANHEVRARRFADDGLSCYLIDYQTSRHILTYQYGQVKLVNTQYLEPGAYVYRMVYERAAKRWKIEDLIQQVPRGWEQKVLSDTEIRLDESLPIAAGRDT